MNTTSSLIIIDVDNGKETPVNLTDFAFAKARTAPDTFKSLFMVLGGKMNILQGRRF